MEQIAAKNNQSVYTFHNNKQTRTPKKNNTRNLSHKASENRPPIFTTTSVYNYYEGLFHNPHQRNSLTSFSYPPSASSLVSSQQKPPLLPLPMAPISRNHSLPCPPPPTARRNRPRKQPKPRTNNDKPNKSEETSPTTDRLGPEPGDLPKSVAVVPMLSLVSPPPSSLPLPRFSVRPSKLGCNAEAAAAGIDAGATDNIRQMLRLP